MIYLDDGLRFNFKVITWESRTRIQDELKRKNKGEIKGEMFLKRCNSIRKYTLCFT